VCRILLSETTILQKKFYLEELCVAEVGSIFQKKPHEIVCAQEYEEEWNTLISHKMS
jgi:hypothetical protein